MPTFTETQQFRQWWIWAILVAVTIITFSAVVLTAEFDPVTLISLTGPVLALLSFYVMRLDTRIDAAGVRYRFFPLLRWRTIPWADIRRTEVRIYSFVGYGIRWDFDAWYYNIGGTWGLHIERSNGRRLVIGTQQPEALKQFLTTLHPAVQP